MVDNNIFSTNYNVHDNYVTIDLDKDQTIEVEPGAFIAGRHVSCKTRNASRGILNAIARIAFSKESIFTNTFTGLVSGHSWVTVAPPQLGQVATYTFKDTSDKIYLTKGSFLASTSNVELSTKFQGIFNLKGIGNTVIEASVLPDESLKGEGKVLFHSKMGAIIPVDVTPDHPLMVDNDHIIAFTGKPNELQCSYKMLSPSLTGYFASGEGYVCEFSGNGTVFVRTHTPHQVPTTSK